MEKKILASVAIAMFSILFPIVMTESGVRYGAAQEKEMTEEWPVNYNLTLYWNIFPEPTIVFVNCSGFNVTVDNVILDLNGHTVKFKAVEKAPGAYGVLVERRHGVTIKNGNITDFQNGIYVRDSTEINIVNNTVSETANIGIGIERKRDPTSNINITGNMLYDNEMEGIWLNTVNDGNISGNMVLNCGYHGMSFIDSSNFTISRNIISGNRPSGIYMDLSDGNTINNNTLSGNEIGLILEESNLNTVCHNNFDHNLKPVEISGSANTWNGTYPCGGNYWSDYDGPDDFCSVYQNVSRCDGIGDIPYVIDQSSDRDKQPLRNPWGIKLSVLEVSWTISQNKAILKMTCPVAVFSNSSVTSLDFNKNAGQISFHTSNGTFCNVIVPKELLSGALTCSIDDVPTESSLSWDNNHTFMYFTYDNQNHTVIIGGETVMKILGDLNNNGIVNIIDIALAAKDFGKEIDRD